MIGNKLNDSKDISLSEVLEILEKRKKKSPLGYEQQTCYDYCVEFSKLPLNELKQMITELTKNEKITEKIAIKIADTFPWKESQLKIILAKERIELSSEEMKEIFDILQTYKEKLEKYKTKKTKKVKEEIKEEKEQAKQKEKKEEIKEEPKKTKVKEEKPKKVKKETKKKSDKK